jgi:hypothetical protein
LPPDRSEEGAVALLHDHFVSVAVVEFRQQFAPIGAGNRDMQIVFPHIQKRIVEIRRKFLSDPENRLAMLPKRRSEHVDGRDKVGALLGEACMPAEEIIEHVND